MAIIQHGKILNGVKVKSDDILKKGHMVSGKKLSSISYLTAHNTGSWDVGAKNHHIALKRFNLEGNKRVASWHFTVDHEQIIQHVDTSIMCFHAGDERGNKNSIGIEICHYKDKVKNKRSEDNAIALMHELMKVHKLSTSKIKPHKYWSGKHCPSVILDNGNGGWDNFMKRITSYNKPSGETSTGGTSTNSEFKNGSYEGKKGKVVVKTNDTLNVREGRGTDFKVLGKLKKDEIVELKYCVDGWIGIPYVGAKGGIGYISTDYIEIIEGKKVFEEKKGYKGVKGKVNTDNLNVRTGRGTSHSIVTKINTGKIVDLGYNIDGWVSIFFDDKEGFVSNKYIDIM